MANALRKAVYYLYSNYPNTQIFYCTPLQSGNTNSGRTYANILNVGNINSEVARRQNVKIIDTTHLSGISGEFENNGGVAGRYTYDGVHTTTPSSASGSEPGAEYGSVLQGRCIAKVFKEKFIV